MTIALIVLAFFVFLNVVISIILFLREEIFGKSLRQETTNALKTFSDTISAQVFSLTAMNEQKLEVMRSVVDERLRDNNLKVEEIKALVDEKLQNTLERRLGDSFKLVSERLELVHKGLGEMQALANDVGDIKKVFTNIKTRGTWGEVQLGSILEDMLTPNQYAKNVITKIGSKERVDFAIKLPGRGDGIVWLPIDAKFPKEDYEKLLDASQKTEIDKIGKRLEEVVKEMAKDVRDKYISPPHTTDFAILFLATEGLYAEIVKRPGFFDYIQREYRILIAGPSILAALLNSLQIGFKTLAIEKRASEVWNLLSFVKNEFGKFGDLLDKTYRQIQIASKTIEDATRESRNIEKRLKDVEVLPQALEHKLIKDGNISSH